MNTEALTGVLDGQWAALRRDVRAQLAENAYDEPRDVTTAEFRAWTLEQLHLLAKTGHPRLGFSPAYGGGGDIGGSVVAFQLLGYADLSVMVKSGVQWGLFGGAVQLLGTERHHQRYLARIMDLDLPGCFAMTETGHGSDVQHLRTTATYDPDTRQFVIDTPDQQARKDYIGNAARDGRLAVVFAQLITEGESRGVHAFLVPIRSEAGEPLPGVEIGDCGRKAGLNGVDNGRLTFRSVRVAREALLNRYGDVAEDGKYTSPIESDNRRFFTMLGTLIRGRISVAGAATCASERALTLAVRYGERRRQFANPDGSGEVAVLDYLGHQRKLLPALAKTYALHFAQEELVRTLHEIQSSEEAVEDRVQRELEARAAGIKATATWHATRSIQTAREACGGAGYLSANVIERLKADTDVFTTFEGDNTVLLQLVAKGLLTNYRDHFADLSPMGTARFVAEQVFETVIERTAARKVIERLVDAAPGRDDDSVVFDRAWQVSLFEDREKHVLEGAARRMRAAADGDPFEVFNNAQDHILRAAQVHVDRVVLEAFVAAIDRCVDDEAREVLGKLCDLYVLSNVEEDRGWFLEHGRLTSARAKAVIAGVNELCRQLRPEARTLVDAFAIPEAFLRAEMLE